MPNDSQNDTTARLRHDIDSGIAGDKVAGLDPAASPLGTDDEAAGTPPSAAAVALARKTETHRQTSRAEATKPSGLIWIMVAIGVIVAAGAYWALKLRG